MAVARRSERAPHGLCLDQADHGGPRRPIHPDGCQRRDHRPETLVTTEYETHDHDVLIIGAGGAGLRAALGALAQGAKVAVVCKSLLAKAHTVMAAGGTVGAMRNVDC